jgi:hypothetical protein
VIKQEVVKTILAMPENISIENIISGINRRIFI